MKNTCTSDNVLVITNRKRDWHLFKELLEPQGLCIKRIFHIDKIESIFFSDTFAAIIADYDLIGDRAYNWIKLLQANRSRSCFILYGEKGKAGKISEILQIGAYAFIHRSLLSERIYETLLGGLENRKAFIEILGMVDDLRDVNEKLEREKETLRDKYQVLSFINRLSNEVAYDLNWDKILPRILDAGLLEALNPSLLGILYRIDIQWHLALYMSNKKNNKAILERLKDDIANRFLDLSGEIISNKGMNLHLYSSDIQDSSSDPIVLPPNWVLPLSPTGNPLGMIAMIPKSKDTCDNGKRELMSTVTNILAMSLKNAQEYHKLKVMAVKDGLTEVFNHKGLKDFIRREFQRAKRYDKPLSLIMIDVDSFKAINDSLGHSAGDYVLQELAGCLKSSVRQSDIVARYGGDEFTILLPETGMEKAKMLMKRVLSSIKNHDFQWKFERIAVEISYGISTSVELEANEGEEELVAKADLRLYHAKRSQNFLYSMDNYSLRPWNMALSQPLQE
jgi:diguanylate cyclase (GGDEF)-like protein